MNLVFSINYEKCYQMDIPLRFIKKPSESKLIKFLHSANEEAFSPKSFNDLEKGSVVFLNNFELWWRKNNNGLSVIKKWIGIFKKYQLNITFIIEVNPVLKNILTQISPFNNLVLKYISTPFLNQKNLVKMVEYKNNLVGLDIYNKGNKKLNWIPFKIFIQPMLKKYLSSVTDGLKYYLENNKKIKKNQFGTHMWFSN